MGLYSLFAAGASRQSFVSCETRNGVFGNCFSYGLALMLTRLCVIQEKDNQLHLLKMAPIAFFEGKGLRWENVPTYFGNISISARFSDKTLNISVVKPQKKVETIVHIPPLQELEQLIINGKRVKYTGEKFFTM